MKTFNIGIIVIIIETFPHKNFSNLGLKSKRCEKLNFCACTYNTEVRERDPYPDVKCPLSFLSRFFCKPCHRHHFDCTFLTLVRNVFYSYYVYSVLSIIYTTLQQKWIMSIRQSSRKRRRNQV